MKKIFLWILAFLVVAWLGYRHWPVTVHVRGTSPEKGFSIRMPLKDKQRLDFFFREVCFLGVWSYTLYGSKPMSIDQYTKPWHAVFNALQRSDLGEVLVGCFCPPNWKRAGYIFEPKHLRIKWGWETLNKYFSRFPDSRFALFTDHNGDCVCLTLVDKVKLMEMVRVHEKDFENVLKDCSLSLEDLLEDEKLDAFLKSFDHNGLYGTLLGYGRDNAWLFHKYQQTDLDAWPMVSAWSEEELENLEQLNQRTCAFQPWELSDMFYPRFACDSQSEETMRLKKIYRDERDAIIKYFVDKDLVEATLSLLNRRLDEITQ